MDPARTRSHPQVQAPNRLLSTPSERRRSWEEGASPRGAGGCPPAAGAGRGCLLRSPPGPGGPAAEPARSPRSSGALSDHSGTRPGSGDTETAGNCPAPWRGRTHLYILPRTKNVNVQRGGTPLPGACTAGSACLGAVMNRPSRILRKQQSKPEPRRSAQRWPPDSGTGPRLLRVRLPPPPLVTCMPINHKHLLTVNS